MALAATGLRLGWTGQGPPTPALSPRLLPLLEREAVLNAGLSTPTDVGLPSVLQPGGEPAPLPTHADVSLTHKRHRHRLDAK